MNCANCFCANVLTSDWEAFHCYQLCFYTRLAEEISKLQAETVWLTESYCATGNPFRNKLSEVNWKGCDVTTAALFCSNKRPNDYESNSYLFSHYNTISLFKHVRKTLSLHIITCLEPRSQSLELGHLYLATRPDFDSHGTFSAHEDTRHGALRTLRHLCSRTQLEAVPSAPTRFLSS